MVLDQIGDVLGHWREVSAAAAQEAGRLVRVEWAGAGGIFHAHAALRCDRPATRRAFGLKRMPSWGTIKGQPVSLKWWEGRYQMRCYDRTVRENYRELAGHAALVERLARRREAALVVGELLGQVTGGRLEAPPHEQLVVRASEAGGDEAD